MSELKRVLRTSVATGIAVSAAVVLAVSGAQAAGTPGWRFAAVYTQVSNMQSVSASSAANAWAVGQTGELGLFTSHWNGKTWQPVAQPAGITYPQVIGAAAAATTGARAWVFVVSMAPEDEGGESAVAAVEWTGTSWSAVHNFAGSPSLGTAIASGPDDVWGFGTAGSSGQTPWAVRYNGKCWSRVAIPVIPSQASGSAAAGDWVTGAVAAQPTRVEVLHWSKGAWRNAALPRISVLTGEQTLPGLIAAAGPASVWATVEIGPPSGAGQLTYVLLHWNGRAWSKVPLPKGVNVYGLASDGHGGSWVASYTVNEPGVILSGLVMYHYSGGHWTHVPAPAKSGFVTNLIGGNMELIPGTRSVLATAILNPSPLPGMFKGAILKYGP